MHRFWYNCYCSVTVRYYRVVSVVKKIFWGDFHPNNKSTTYRDTLLAISVTVLSQLGKYVVIFISQTLSRYSVGIIQIIYHLMCSQLEPTHRVHIAYGATIHIILNILQNIKQYIILYTFYYQLCILCPRWIYIYPSWLCLLFIINTSIL